MHARVRYGLLLAAAAAGGIALLRWLAFSVPAVHHRDALALHDFMALDRPFTHRIASFVADLANPLEYGVIGAAIIAVALLRRRRELAVAAGVILLGSAFTTDYVLKPALATPRFAEVLAWHQIDRTAFPSGHATASMALALSAVLVVGPRLRPLAVGIGALFAIAVSYSLMSLGWHYPSDVLGGYLVAAGWTGVAVAALSLGASPVAARRAIARVEWVPALAIPLLVAALAVVAVALVSPDRALEYLRTHEVLAAAAATIAAAGVTVAGGLALLLRDRPD
jgi:membrane-associated phospholipid phosphatase